MLLDQHFSKLARSLQNTLALVVGSTVDRYNERESIMTNRLFSGQAVFSMFSALICSAVLINIATSLVPVA